MLDRILVVDDEPVVLDFLSEVLTREGFAVSLAAHPEQALERLSTSPHDLVLCDIRMPGMDGFEVLRRVARTHPGTDVILMTGYASVDGAIDAMQLGAADYLIKPLKPKEIVARIRSCLRRRSLEAEVGELRDEVSARNGPERVFARSARMAAVVTALRRLAESEVPVVLRGEPGSGRRFLARVLHHTGPRRDQPLGEVDCELASPTQMAELLFGRPRSSVRRTPGQLERSAGGSLLLVGAEHLPRDVQALLGTALREGTWSSPGDGGPQELRTRLVFTCSDSSEEPGAALGPELAELPDLVTIQVPPLRERAEDLPELIRAFVEELGVEHGRMLKVSPESVELLAGRDFLGNARQLRTALGHACTLTTDGVLSPDVIGRALEHASDEGAGGGCMATHLDEREYQLVLRAVQNHPRRLDEAARELGVSRTTLWRRMRKYGIQVGSPHPRRAGR